MKVTALLPDKLIGEVTRTAQGKTLTESLLIALGEWLAQKRLAQLHARVAQRPLQFTKQYSAAAARQLNRRS